MIDKNRIEKAVLEILYAIGENPDREGLKNTPKRIANMYEEIFSGLHKDIKDSITIFTDEKHNEIVLIRDIPLYSMCEHHLLPFFGVAHVAYIPDKNKLLGLSKIARIVEHISKKPQLQERLTSEIADTLIEYISPAGVVVMVEAEHLCIAMRGIKKASTKTLTSAVRGIVKNNEKVRNEILFLMKAK